MQLIIGIGFGILVSYLYIYFFGRQRLSVQSEQVLKQEMKKSDDKITKLQDKIKDVQDDKTDYTAADLVNEFKQLQL